MERKAYFDNAKFVLIFLVVFGHMIQPFKTDHALVGTLYTWMYTFHMPVFIFLAGFFAKGSGKLADIKKLAKKLLVPYIVFQVIYTIFYFNFGNLPLWTDSLFYPHWSLWFLVSLFCWHLLLVIYRQIPKVWSVALAFSVGIVIGYFDDVGHMFSLSRTFVFFPYFLLGYLLSEHDVLQLTKKSVKGTAAFILIGSAVIIYLLPDIQTGWLLNSKSYSDLGVYVAGGITRTFVYLTAIIMGLSVLAWIPKGTLHITPLGARTLYVYLLHGFFIQLFRYFNLFHVEGILDFIGLAILSLCIVLFLSSRLVISLWQPLIEGSTSMIKKLLFNRRKINV